MAKKPNHHMFKRGDTWYFQMTANGRPYKKALGTDVSLARVLRDQFLHKIRWGHLDVQRERLVLGEVAERWIKLEGMKLQPSTLQDYRSIMNFHVLPSLGNWYIDQIKPVDVEEFMATRDCGPKRINNILVPLRSVFRMAKKNDFVERNIMLDVQNLSVDRPRISPLSMEEAVRFLEAVSPHYRNFFVTAFFTGLRLGEQAALKWREVDWDRKIISIVESRVMGIEGRPKTKGSYRDIHMLPVVEEALRDQRRRNKLKSPYVFLNKDGEPVDGETLRKTTWTPGLERVGLEYRSMYHTRHTFATLMLSSGENVGWVQRMMGHASLQMIHQRYYRYIPNLTHADGSAFAEKFRKDLVRVTPNPPQNDEGDHPMKVIPLNRT